MTFLEISEKKTCSTFVTSEREVREWYKWVMHIPLCTLSKYFNQKILCDNSWDFWQMYLNSFPDFIGRKFVNKPFEVSDDKLAGVGNQVNPLHYLSVIAL